MQQDTLWYFENVDLYKIFCPHYVKAYEDNTPHCFVDHPKDDFIYFEADQSEKVYLISEGKVKIGSYLPDGKEITKAVLTRGEIFGEMAIMGEGKRKDFAQAMTTVSLCPLTVDQMESLMLEHKSFSVKIRELIGWRLRKAERLITSLMYKSSRDRVIEYLIDLVDEKGEKVGFEHVVRHFFSHKIIGSLTATSRQTVTTVLNELRAKEILTFDRRRLLIRDLDLLKAEVNAS